MIPARQSTALEIAVGPVLDADGVAVTNCVVGDFKIKKTTGNFAALNGSATLTHVSAGVYDLVLTTSDTDTVGLCTIAIDDTVNACQSIYLQVLEEAVYDMLYAASATGYIVNQPVDVNTIKTQSVTCGAGVTVLASVGTAATSTAQTGDSYAIVNSGTHGNAALKTLIDAVDNFIDTEIADIQSRVPSSTAAGNMTTVFDTDFATNYDTTEDRWVVLTRKIWDWNNSEYVEPMIDGANHGIVIGGITGGAGSDIATEVWAKDPANLGVTSPHSTFAALIDGLENELDKVPKSDGSSTWNAAALASINAQCDTALADYDGPTNAEMVARTLAAADYATAAALDAVDNYIDTEIGALTTAVADLPTNAELATALAAADDAVLAAIATAQNDLDVLTGVDGVVLATNQPNYVPATSSQIVAIQGAGFDGSTDSLEALRNRGDSAWTTATGFSTHSAADVWSAATRTLTALDEDSTTLDLDATIRAAIGLASANLDTQLSNLNTDVDSIYTLLDTEFPALTSTVGSLFTTAMAESYGADGATVTPAQAFYEIMQSIGERSISGTTATVKKRDGSTTAFTQTLNDAVTPTAITRS